MHTTAFLALLLVPVLGQLEPGEHTRSVEIGDLTGSYIVHVPPSYDGYKPLPVVLIFHGGGSNAEQMTNFYSVEHSIRAWVKANGCPTEPKVEKMPDKADDGMTVTKKTYGPGKDGAEVVLFVIEGGGHTWPGREPLVQRLGKSTSDISANDLMWEFFKRHPKSSDTQ